MFHMEHRYDIIAAANLARFYLRHYARGIYPPASLHSPCLPVNRMFFPLRNPNGDGNYIRDCHGVYELKPGQFYFIPAFHATEVHLDEKLYFFSVQSNLEIYPGIELFSDCSSIKVLPVPAELEQLQELFESSPENAAFSALKCKTVVFSMLVRLIKYYPAREFLKPLSLRRYSILTEYLQHHGNAQTRVTKLAELVHESREGFSRRFALDTGITPKQMIDRFLMGKALDLLNSERSIKEVADQLNFSSEFSFSRFFKKQMGEAPSNWRKRSGESSYYFSSRLVAGYPENSDF